MDDEDFSSPYASCCDPPHYAFSGKLMLICVLIFFFVCLLIAVFYLYSNQLLRARHHHLHRRHHYHPASPVFSQGLDSSLLESLPVFVYDAKGCKAPIECPVCLAEFENGEKGRVLPKCGHCFHCECIDMWFQSHSSCPVCRAPIQSIEVKEINPSELERELAQVVIDQVRPCDFSSSSESFQSDNDSVGVIAIITNPLPIKEN